MEPDYGQEMTTMTTLMLHLANGAHLRIDAEGEDAVGGVLEALIRNQEGLLDLLTAGEPDGEDEEYDDDPEDEDDDDC